MTRLNVQVRFTSKTILNGCDRLDMMQFVTKTRQDKDVTDCIGMVYAETKTKLLGPTEPSMVCYEK